MADKHVGDPFITVCATVSTGLESVAVQECKEKLDCKSIREGRGRIYFEIPVNSFSKVKTLRSVEHLFVVIKEFQENSDELDCYSPEVLEKIYKLPQELEWGFSLSLWKQFTEYSGILFKSELSEEIPGKFEASKDKDDRNSVEDSSVEAVTENGSREAPAKRMKHSNEESGEEKVRSEGNEITSKV